MSSRVLSTVPDHLLDDAQRAVRALLLYGLVTPSHPDEATFRRVRRWAPEISAELEALTGWTLHDTRSAVRLERRSDVLDAVRWWPVPGIEPDARLLTLFCLVLAGLERAGDQVLLSELAVAVRTAAARAGLMFDPAVHLDRRSFCHAVAAVERLGIVRVQDGLVESWRDASGAGEALLDVDPDVLGLVYLPTRGLHAVTSGAELLVAQTEAPSRDVARLRRRQRVVRRLLDRPVVYFADLDEADHTYVRLEIQRVATDLERLTGGYLERRLEGLALVVTDAGGAADTLPGSGSDNLAALALATDLTRALEAAEPLTTCPPAAHPPPSRGDGDLRSPVARAQEVFVSDAALRDAARLHLLGLGSGLRRDLQDPEAFARAGITRLARFDLVRPVPGGVCVMPAVARFRDAHLESLPKDAP